MSAPPWEDPAAPSPQMALVIDRACDRFEKAWKAAGPGGEQRPAVERYLGPMQEPARLLLLTELLALDVAYRRRLGEGPAADDYRARFPEADAVLAALFAPTTPGER